MNTQLLIDSIVRHTTVLIAQLATAGGVRAPLANIANQVFLDLTRALKDQGISRKVSADMFGMAFRAYLRKIQRLSESSTETGRSLWEAVYTHIDSRPMITRQELLDRFSRDEPMLVRGVLRDLTESGLVFASGVGPATVFRATSEEELATLRGKPGTGLDELLWVMIYREGPLDAAAIRTPGGDSDAVLAALSRLQDSGRIRVCTDGRWASAEFVVSRDDEAGFEAAVFDHYHALVKTICCRLNPDEELDVPGTAVGGSTYTFDVWPGHPHYDEALSVLERHRDALGALRQRIEAHNAAQGMPDRFVQVVAYAGQCALLQETQDDV